MFFFQVLIKCLSLCLDEESSGSGSGSEEEVELNLEFDENGRIGSWGGKVDFGFRSFTNAVQLTNKPQISKYYYNAYHL